MIDISIFSDEIYVRDLSNLQIKTLGEGLKFLLFLLDNIKDGVGFSFSLCDNLRKDQPSITVQQEDDRYLFDIFLPESLVGGDGACYFLVEQEIDKTFDELTFSYWGEDEPKRDGYFYVKSIEGFYYSTSLLVSKTTLRAFISKFNGDVLEWHRYGKWKYYGIYGDIDGGDPMIKGYSR